MLLPPFNFTFVQQIKTLTIFRVRHICKIYFLIVAISCSSKAYAQTEAFSRSTLYAHYYVPLKDSVAKEKKKFRWDAPGNVALQSAIIPGLGQVTNGHWWKVPIIYAGFATCGYIFYFNNKEYTTFRDAYRLRTDDDTTTLDIFDRKNPAHDPARVYSEQGLLLLRESYRQDRDLTIIVTVILYSANILDAYVFAHLKDFDVSDNLSMQLMPLQITNIAGNYHYTSGVRLNLK